METTHEILAIIWFALWGVLWAVYFMLDGFDLGVGSLMPFLAKNETEKRIMYNTTGPFWDGNEVWLISAGGVTFAAFPYAYAQLFSGLYTALMLLLFCLILRGVSFEFRSKVESDSWKKVWDACQFLGSLLPALLLGVAFANLFRGLPLNELGFNTGTIFGLLNPYGLAGGVLFVVMFLMHGALWLTIRTEGALKARAESVATKLWPVLVVGTVLFLAYTAVETQLFANYFKMPVLFVVLAIPVAGLVLMRTNMGAGKSWLAWAFSSLYIVGVAAFGLVGMFPALLISNPNPGNSVLATDVTVASSQLTLTVMLVVALIFVPIVIGYQFWVYRTFATEPVREAELEY